MDVRVEATILLDQFQDETEVLEILRSQGFQLSDPGGGRVHITGYFFQLKAVKVRLEQLIETQTTTLLRSPSPSSGAVSKYYNQDSRGRTRSRDKPPPPSSASKLHPAASVRSRHEVVVVDADVFRYARRLRKTDVDSILDHYQVQIQVQETSSSSTITLQGRRSRPAAAELQNLLEDLSRTLRTQQVPLRDVDPDGDAFLQEIRGNRHVFNSVLVCEMEDRLHLIGPSVESYQVKQRLLGRQVKPSGKPLDSNHSNSLAPSRNHSNSLSPHSRKNPEREGRSNPGSTSSRNQEYEPEAAHVPPRSGASRGRSSSETRGRKGPERANDLEPQTGSGFDRHPGGAAGSSSSRNQEDKPESADVVPKSGSSRTRSQSEPRRPKEPEKYNDVELEKGNKLQLSKQQKSFFQRLFVWKFLKSKSKKNRKT